MNWIPGKLKLIRQEFRMTQLELAQASGLSQRDISQLENGRKEGLPKEFIQFLHTRGVDLNWLFTDPAQEPAAQSTSAATAKKYASSDDANLVALAQEGAAVAYGQATPTAATAAPATGAAVLSMVSTEMLPQYPVRHLAPEFCQALPTFTLALPEVQQGTFRCFQVADTGLLPAFSPHDWLITRREEKTAAITSGAFYVVVTKEALYIEWATVVGTRAKALLLGPAGVGLPERQVPMRDIVELWSVQGRLSFQLPAATEAEPKGSGLEASLQDLLNRVQRLEQGR